MAGRAERLAMPLMEAILARAGRMNFYRLCEILEERGAAFGQDETLEREPVRFHPWPGLGFPASEIAAVERDEERPETPPVLRTTFLGLYGVDAAVPHYFLDDIAARREGAEALAAFLDVFNHRLTALYYRVWKKYRYPVGYKAGGRDPMSRCLLSLAGLGLGNLMERRAGWALDMLALIGLFTQRTRPAEGLAAVIRRVLPGAKVSVEEFFPVRRELPNRLKLGQGGMPLKAGSLVLGRFMRDVGSAVRAVIIPAEAEGLAELFPGGETRGHLMAIMAAYVGHKVEVLLTLKVARAFLPPPRLSRAHKPRLGLCAIGGGEGFLMINLARYKGPFEMKVD